MKQHFMMFAAYNQWANDALYQAVAQLTSEEFERELGLFFHSIMGTLNHLLVADRIWMKRFTGGGHAPATLNAIVTRDLTKLRNARIAEDARIVEWVASQSEENLAGRFTYMTATDMRTISQRVAPALAHFFNHQAHHRGQIHAVLTGLGKPSVALDLIYFQRTEEGRAFA